MDAYGGGGSKSVLKLGPHPDTINKRNKPTDENTIFNFITASFISYEIMVG